MAPCPPQGARRTGGAGDRNVRRSALKDANAKTVIPDGAIVCRRGKKTWTCLVEVKTGSAVCPSPRERLLEAADELFYEQSICTVGVDLILKHADVARASLYTTYGSKEELVRAYLQGRSDDWQALVDEVLPSRWTTPATGSSASSNCSPSGSRPPDTAAARSSTPAPKPAQRPPSSRSARPTARGSATSSRGSGATPAPRIPTPSQLSSYCSTTVP
jgi:hypothetical protein